MIVRWLFFLIVVYGSNKAVGQELMLADAAVKPLKINAKISKALLANDTSQFFLLLQADKSLADASVLEVPLEGDYGLVYKQKQAILHYLIRAAIENKISTNVVSRFLTFNPNLALEFDKKSAFYYLLDFVATHSINETPIAETLIKLIATQPTFNINKPYSDFLPPLPYLLRTNYTFLKNNYNEKYVNEDLVIFFIEKGANVNTYDQQENNLTAFSTQGHTQRLLPFLQSKGGSFQNTNLSGKDAFYFAVQSNNINAVKQILEGGYQLSVKKAAELKINEGLNKSNSELLAYLTNYLYNKIITYNDMVWFAGLFNESKGLLLKNNMYKKIGVPDNRIPEFVKLFEQDVNIADKESITKIHQLRIDYLNNATNVKQLKERQIVFNLFNLKNYAIDYYATDEKTAKIKNEINGLDAKLIYVDTKTLLVESINNDRQVAKRLADDFDVWEKSKPDDYLKMAKITFLVPEGLDYINITNDAKAYLLSLNRESANVLYIDTKNIVEEVYGIGIKGNKGIICLRWYREGIISDGDMLTVNSGFAAFDNKVSNYLQRYGITNVNAKYLGSMAYDDEVKARRLAFKQKQCDNCVADEKKSEYPKIVEKWNYISGTYTEKEYGTITMKNGKKFRWDLKKDKWVFVEEGLFADSKTEFDSFEKMYARLIEECKRAYCQ